MKVGMIGIGSTPSTANFSHNAGWTYVLTSIIQYRFGDVDIVKNGNAIHQYDVLIINEGLNYKAGSFNFFGGMQPDALVRLENLAKYRGDVYCFNEQIEWSALSKRKEVREQENFRVEDLPAVRLIKTYDTRKLILGDSHTVSIYRPDWGISRNDGKTLFGALRPTGLLGSLNTSDYDDLHLYLGNIDIRFHLARQKDPLQAVHELCEEYRNWVLDQDCNITVQGLIPAEDESRKIPGTGLYKGQPFFGSRELRNEMVTLFNELMYAFSEPYGYEYRGWDLPADGFDAPKFECMESRQSVHLKPKYYKNKRNLNIK